MKYICEKAKECKTHCRHKYGHNDSFDCLQKCRNDFGIKDSKCIPIEEKSEMKVDIEYRVIVGNMGSVYYSYETVEGARDQAEKLAHRSVGEKIHIHKVTHTDTPIEYCIALNPIEWHEL